MNYLNRYYNKRNDVRVRHVEEWDYYLVYAAELQNILMINTSAYIILQLCNGRRGSEIQEAYINIVKNYMNPENAKDQVKKALNLLQKRKLVIDKK